MKALFLVAIIANFISIISNLSLVIFLTAFEDYFNGDRFGY